MERMSGFVGEEIAFRLNGDLVFHASRFDDQKYTTLFWDVNPIISKESYVRKLAWFCNAMEKVSGATQLQRKINGTVFLTYGKDEPEYASEDSEKKFQDTIPLGQLRGDKPQLFSHPHFADFALLRAYTPYGDATMEDFSGIWKPETGRISVISHNDLSTIVAGLIAETAKYSVPADDLITTLKQKAYGFKFVGTLNQGSYS